MNESFKKDEIRERVLKIFNIFNGLKKLLSERYRCTENLIEIHDPPHIIRILKSEELIIFYQLDEEIAVLGRNEIKIKKGFEDYVRKWLIALTSFEFKRYIIKK